MDQILKCPYCPSTRTSRTLLAVHCFGTHPDADFARVAAAAERRAEVEVERPEPLAHPNAARFRDHAEFQCPRCDQTRLSVMALTNHLRQGHHLPVKDAQRQAATVATLAADPVDRTEAATAGLEAAKQELTALKEAADSVARRMQALEDAASKPSAIRRRALNEAEDRLLAAGNISGFQLIRQMIQEGS